ATSAACRPGPSSDQARARSRAPAAGMPSPSRYGRRVRGRLTRRVAGEPFLARLQELLRPTVVEVLIDPFLAAQLSNAVLAAQAFQHNADLLFSGMMPACGSANIPDCLFSAVRYALARLSHRCSSTGYDEPAILSYAISSFCPTSADCMSSEHFGQFAWQFKRMSGSSGLKVQR